MDLKRLRYFCVIVEQGSISKASRILNISQPPLSKRLQELEEEVGTQLVLRNGSGIATTEAGMVLYLRACDILRSVEEARSEAIFVANNKKEVLRIGISYLFQRHFSPLVASFYQQLEGVKIETIVADSSTLEGMLDKKRIDIGLFQQPTMAASYECISMQPVKAVALISKKLLPSPPKEQVLLSELGQLPLILIRRINGEGTFEYISNQLLRVGVQPNIIISANEPRMVCELIASGIAAASMMPASEVPPQAKEYCHIVDIYPAPNIFFPSFVKLAATPHQPELMNILLHYQENNA